MIALYTVACGLAIFVLATVALRMYEDGVDEPRILHVSRWAGLIIAVTGVLMGVL